MKISEWLKYKLDSENLSLRKAKDKYSLSHNQIGLILKGKYDDPSVLVAKNLVNTFYIDEETLLSLLPEKDPEFFEEVYEEAGNTSCEKALNRFIDIYFKSEDNGLCYEEIASDDSLISGRYYNVSYINTKINRYSIPGYQAIVKSTISVKKDVLPDESDVNWTPSWNGDEGYETPYAVDEYTNCSFVYHLPYRSIRSNTKYHDENIRDFSNKLLNLLSHNSEADSYIFFTTSKNLFDYIRSMFEIKLNSKPIILVFLPNNSNKFEKFFIS